MTTNIPGSVCSGLMTVQLAGAHPVLMPESQLERWASNHLQPSAIDQAEHAFTFILTPYFLYLLQ